MAEKGKRALIEDSFSQDEELKGNNKNGFGISSALEDVDGAPEEMREKKKQKLAMPSSPDVENKPALLSGNGVVELEPIADNVENDDVTNPSQSVEMAKDVEGTRILQPHYVLKAEDSSEVPIDMVPEETKGTKEDRFSDHNDNIDDKEEDKQGEASIGVKTMLMVEGELVFRNENMAPQKLLIGWHATNVVKIITGEVHIEEKENHATFVVI